MRILLNYLSSASKPALVIGAGVLLIGALPIYAQAAQGDILLPAADAPPMFDESTPDPDLPIEPAPTATAPDPSALTAPVDPSTAAQAEDAMDDLLKKIDAGAEEVKAPEPTVPEVEAEQAVATPPADTTLVSPDATAPAKDITTPTNVTEIPALPAASAPDENLFFDADNLVPEGEMGTKSGPRKVNPSLQPASKLIVVTKNAAPNSREAQLVAAERAVALGRYDSALEMYNALYQKNKRDPNILMGRAVALQHLGFDDEAVNAYEELLDIRPENVQAQVNMVGLIGQRYPAVGLQRLIDLRSQAPENVALVGQIAVMQANMGNTAEALKYLGMAASMEPHNANHLFNMAVLADRAGKKEEAVSFYEQALEVDSVYGGGRTVPRDAIYERLARLR